MYNHPDTPFKSFYKEIKEYILKKDDNYFTFLIRTTQDKILINSNYYEIIINKDEIYNLTNINFGNIDNASIFINNLFNQGNAKIKAITSETIELELIINNSQNKRVELCLSENLDNQYYLFKDLYQKQMNLVKELNLISWILIIIFLFYLTKDKNQIYLFFNDINSFFIYIFSCLSLKLSSFKKLSSFTKFICF